MLGRSSPPSLLKAPYWKLLDRSKLCCRCISAVGGRGYLNGAGKREKIAAVWCQYLYSLCFSVDAARGSEGASRLTHWSAAAQTCCALGCQCPPRQREPHICPRPAVLLRQCTAVLHSGSPSPVLVASLLPAVAATSNMRILTSCSHWSNSHLQRLLPMLPHA